MHLLETILSHGFGVLYGSRTVYVGLTQNKLLLMFMSRNKGCVTQCNGVAH